MKEVKYPDVGSIVMDMAGGGVEYVVMKVIDDSIQLKALDPPEDREVNLYELIHDFETVREARRFF